MTKNYQTKRPRAAALEPEIALPETANIAMAVRGQAHEQESREGVTRGNAKGVTRTRTPFQFHPIFARHRQPRKAHRGRAVSR